VPIFFLRECVSTQGLNVKDGAEGLLGILALPSKAIFASSCCLLLLLLVSGGRGIYQLPLSTTLGGLWQPILQRDFQLIPTNNASVNAASLY
jgi:hypothetical protein